MYVLYRTCLYDIHIHKKEHNTNNHSTLLIRIPAQMWSGSHEDVGPWVFTSTALKERAGTKRWQTTLPG
eukprot:scaffold50508_cov30-Tisochrysis_lutea.AAC.3